MHLCVEGTELYTNFSIEMATDEEKFASIAEIMVKN